MMFVTAAVGVLAAAAVPQLTATIEHTRTIGAARYLAARLAFARSQAVARSANVAILLTMTGDTAVMAIYVDENGNGVRTRDIAGGIDRVTGTPVRLADLFPHVAVSLNDPDNSLATTSVLMSFTPLGTASSGTVYLRGRDGSQYAVRVLGATGRARVLRYAATMRTWVEVL
jgi:Tfp pilus assembly protein FimT